MFWKQAIARRAGASPLNVPQPKADRILAVGSVVLVLMAGFATAGCDSKSPVELSSRQIAAVEVEPPSVVLAIGAQRQVKATVLNAAHEILTGFEVTWNTNAPQVASVSSDGTIVAVGGGTATITASTGGKEATVLVTVLSESGGGGGSGSSDLVVVNPAVRYQTITGWEATAQAGQANDDYLLYRDRLFDMIVDAGINRVRVEVRSGLEHTQDYYTQWRLGQISDSTWRCVRFSTVNDNSDPNSINSSGFQFSQLDASVESLVQPLRQRLQANGQQLFITLTYTAFVSQNCAGTAYHHNNPQEYAEFILAASLHLRTRHGITPDAWEVILEPENTNYFRGKTIGDAIAATAPKLSANGFTPRFIAPSTTRSFNAVPYFDAMITQAPGIKPYLLELSYHRYSSTSPTELQTIAAKATQNGIRASMLEHLKSGYEDLHDDLKYAQVTAWQQYALAFGAIDDGSQYFLIDRSNPANPQVKIASRTKFLRQYFRFIRRGAVRIDATSGTSVVDPLAFINTDGGYVVVAKTTGAADFGIQGLPAGTYGIKYTTLALYDVNLPDVTIAAGQRVDASIPQRGVVTIYRK